METKFHTLKRVVVTLKIGPRSPKSNQLVPSSQQCICASLVKISPSVQKITRIDVYETLCPQQMLVHKGGKIKNWGGECRDVTPTKSLSQNIRVDVNREVKFL